MTIIDDNRAMLDKIDALDNPIAEGLDNPTAEAEGLDYDLECDECDHQLANYYDDDDISDMTLCDQCLIKWLRKLLKVVRFELSCHQEAECNQQDNQQAKS